MVHFKHYKNIKHNKTNLTSQYICTLIAISATHTQTHAPLSIQQHLIIKKMRYIPDTDPYLMQMLRQLQVVKNSENDLKQVPPPVALKRLTVCLHDFKHNSQSSEKENKHTKPFKLLRVCVWWKA